MYAIPFGIVKIEELSSDATKKHAEKIENPARVRNGNEEELGWGYWTLNIVGANTKGPKIVPL
jgi:hypothetical protein